MTNYIEENLILYIITILINLFVGSLITYDTYISTRVVPPGFVFGFVWLLIYILLGVFTITNYIYKDNADVNNNETLCGYVTTIGESIGPFLIINLCLNITWLLVRGIFGGNELGRLINLVVIICILSTLVVMYQNVNKDLDVRNNWSYYFGYYSWLPIYLGWIVIATILSFATHTSHVTGIDHGIYYNIILLFVSVVIFFSTFDLLIMIPFFFAFLTLLAREQDPSNMLGLIFSTIAIIISGFYRY